MRSTHSVLTCFLCSALALGEAFGMQPPCSQYLLGSMEHKKLPSSETNQ